MFDYTTRYLITSVFFMRLNLAYIVFNGDQPRYIIVDKKSGPTYLWFGNVVTDNVGERDSQRRTLGDDGVRVSLVGRDSIEQ